jgi:hypothetical protein
MTTSTNAPTTPSGAPEQRKRHNRLPVAIAAGAAAIVLFGLAFVLVALVVFARVQATDTGSGTPPRQGVQQNEPNPKAAPPVAGSKPAPAGSLCSLVDTNLMAKLIGKPVVSYGADTSATAAGYTDCSFYGKTEANGGANAGKVFQECGGAATQFLQKHPYLQNAPQLPNSIPGATFFGNEAVGPQAITSGNGNEECLLAIDAPFAPPGSESVFATALKQAYDRKTHKS